MDQDSRPLTARQRYVGTVQKDKPDRLGEVLAEHVTRHITPQQGQLEQLSKVWARMVPAQLHHHCAITQLSGGQLKVQVDSPSHLYRLRSLTSELLDELSRCSPRVPVKKIKFLIGPTFDAKCSPQSEVRSPKDSLRRTLRGRLTAGTRYDGNRESRIQNRER